MFAGKFNMADFIDVDGVRLVFRLIQVEFSHCDSSDVQMKTLGKLLTGKR